MMENDDIITALERLSQMLSDLHEITTTTNVAAYPKGFVDTDDKDDICPECGEQPCVCPDAV